MKNKIIKLCCVFVSLFFVVLTVQAWYIPNKTSFALGAVYDDDVDTTVDANNAHTAYSSMGLDYTKKINNPTQSSVLGNHSNGTSYLNSGIVFLSGHGLSTHQAMVFQNNGTGTFYIGTGISSGNWIGVQNYVSSLNALVVLGGCETAAGTTNISKYVVDQGAKSSIGWTTSIIAGSHTNWLKRFNNKIKDKTTTVSSAKSSADGYIYIDSRVKNGKIYGFGNYNPWYFMNGGSSSRALSLSNYEKELNYLSPNQTLITKQLSGSNLTDTFKQYIINNVDENFESENYVLEINGTDTKYYDYILYIDGVRTDYGYTVSVENGSVAKLLNNMKDKKVDTLKAKLSKKISVKSNYNNIDEQLDSKVNRDYPNSVIKRYLLTNYYDETNDTIYRIAIYDITDQNGILHSEEYREKI